MQTPIITNNIPLIALGNGSFRMTLKGMKTSGLVKKLIKAMKIREKNGELVLVFVNEAYTSKVTNIIIIIIKNIIIIIIIIIIMVYLICKLYFMS